MGCPEGGFFDVVLGLDLLATQTVLAAGNRGDAAPPVQPQGAWANCSPHGSRLPPVRWQPFCTCWDLHKTLLALVCSPAVPTAAGRPMRIRLPDTAACVAAMGSGALGQCQSTRGVLALVIISASTDHWWAPFRHNRKQQPQWMLAVQVAY
jgi:hypothetical protein